MIKNKSRKIAAFVIAAMMAASVTPAMAAPSFASEENTEAITTDAEEMIEETEEVAAEPGEIAAESEEVTADVEEITEEAEEVVVEEPQQENVISAKGSVKAMAATTPSQAQSISIGQRVTGSFLKSEKGITHYYKFRTSSASGVSYTFKAEFLSYIPDANNDGLNFGLQDRNYNNVINSNRKWSMFLSNIAGNSGSITYDNLTPNTYYYIWVENAWISLNAKKYAVTITSSSNSGTTTPSLVTPVLTLDKTRISAADANNVYVTGKVSYACGQYVGVYDADGRVCYNVVTLGNTKRSESFNLRVPERYLNKGTNTFKVKSMPLRNVVNTSNTVSLTVEIGQENKTQTHSTWYPVYKTTVNGSVYEILQHKEIGGPAARLVKAKNAKSITIPATVKFKGVHYNVTGIQPNAFKGSKVKTVTIKTRMLSKASVKNSFLGSKVKTVKVKTVNKKLSKSFVKQYKKFFTKGNCGKKVKVK